MVRREWNISIALRLRYLSSAYCRLLTRTLQRWAVYALSTRSRPLLLDFLMIQTKLKLNVLSKLERASCNLINLYGYIL